jgi:hypothetical protein
LHLDFDFVFPPTPVGAAAVELYPQYQSMHNPHTAPTSIGNAAVLFSSFFSNFLIQERKWAAAVIDCLLCARNQGIHHVQRRHLL